MSALLLAVMLLGPANASPAQDTTSAQSDAQAKPESPREDQEPMRVVPARELVPDYDPNEWDWAYDQEGHRA